MPTTGADIFPQNYRLLQDRIYLHTGIVIEDNKHYLLESRLAPIVKQLGLGTINELCAVLQTENDHDLNLQVVEAMTTNETYFFREPAHYQAINSTLLPQLKQERAATKRLRFWSAAASTGQEAHSLAMLLLDAGLSDWNTQILGTDFSPKVLEKARAGRYQQIEVNRGLPPRNLVKYFHQCGLDWRLGDTVLRMSRFETTDLRKSMRGLGPFDLVFCRNVLIYFDAETKRSIIQQIHGTLFRGGWLLLGGAETVFGVEEWFSKQTIDGATVYIAR